MATKHGFAVTSIVALIMLIMASSSSIVTSRPLMKQTMDPSSSPTTSLVYNLDEEETGYCWDSLMQLQHCSGELILFFLNGETYIGPGCCDAIRSVGSKCWTNMIGVLGYTDQEGDMLQGYCDGNDSDDNNNNNNGGDDDRHHALATSPLRLRPNMVVRSFNP
ncbi:unnamed protein product [Cochlearia groenlandica]